MKQNTKPYVYTKEQIKRLSLAAGLAFGIFALTACSDDNDLEDAADDLGDAIEDAGDHAADAIEDAADAVRDATN